MLLEGRKALVTGASSGIGRATALRLAREGAGVCVNYYSSREQGDAADVIGEIERAGGHAFAVQGDVGDEEQAARLVSRAAHELEGLDLLVNSAGIQKEVPLLDLSLHDWDAVIRTNLTGSFLCLREAGKVMAASGGGVVVNISSVHEHLPRPGHAHYCAAKAGLKLLMETAARELAPMGIRIVNVAPGAILTSMNRYAVDNPGARSTIGNGIPLGRMGEPEEIAAAVAWLASDQAGYATGTTVVVDGGLSLSPP